jgi:hypothetical protein
MKTAVALLAMLLCAACAWAQAKPPQSEPSPTELKSVTVPFTLDHNRIVVNAGLPLPDSTVLRVAAWIDNGNPDLEMSRRVATLLNLNVSCSSATCSAPPPTAIDIGGMKVSLEAIKTVSIPLKPVSAAAIMAAGMSAEVNIPSTILRSYDVLVDFPVRKLTIAQHGTLKFQGVSSKAQVNSANGLIQIASEIENRKCNLALDLGSSISFLSAEIFDRLAAAHPAWPRMTGAVGPANMWGLADEPKWKLMRLERLQYGPLHLTDVAFVEFPNDRADFFVKRAGVPTAGLLGTEALLNYRVGLDYTHSTVYFDIGRMVKLPNFDVVGLTLRPEDDGLFTVIGVADYGGQASTPEGSDGVQIGDHLAAIDGIAVRGSTLGQVWPLLAGVPGEEHKLVVERKGKEIRVTAAVQHFLGEPSPETESTENPSK